MVIKSRPQRQTEPTGTDIFTRGAITEIKSGKKKKNATAVQEGINYGNLPVGAHTSNVTEIAMTTNCNTGKRSNALAARLQQRSSLQLWGKTGHLAINRLRPPRALDIHSKVQPTPSCYTVSDVDHRSNRCTVRCERVGKFASRNTDTRTKQPFYLSACARGSQ